MAFNLTAQLNIALNSASLRNASTQLNSALNTNTQIKLGIDRNSSSGLNQIKSQISEATDSMENFGRQAGFAAKRFAAFAVTAGSIIAFTNTMKEAVSAAVDFDREMVRLRQVSSDTVQDVGAVGDQVTNLSKNLGVSSKDLIGVAVVLKQANLTLSETKDALEAMAQAALAPNFDNLKDTTEGAIAIMKQFKVEAKDLGAALGSVNAVAGEFAVEASDIIEAIRKTGGAFKAAGGQLNELIALFTSVRQTTRESAESIGTGLRTIFTRIQRNDTANALKEVGINLRYTAEEARALGDAGLEQQFVGPYEAVKRLSAGLSDLRSTDPRFSAIVEQLGGYRQISKVIPLIQEFATAQKALGVAQAGSVSLAVNAGQAQDALAVKLQKLKESFFEVGRSIVNSPGFRSLADTFIGAATSVLSLINSLKGLLPLFTALAAVKIGQGLGSFATGFVKGAGADSSSARTTRKADGGFLKMRTGGIVPGSGTGDKVPALLEPGELVVPRNQVRRTKYYKAGPVKLEKVGGKKDTSSINTLINNDPTKRLNKQDTIEMEIVEKKQKLLSNEHKKDIYSSYRLEDSDVELYSDPNFRPIMYASDNTKPKTVISTAEALENYKSQNPKFKELLSIDYLKKLKKKIAPAEAAWGKKFENITLEKNSSTIQAATRPIINGKIVAESTYPVDTETINPIKRKYGDIKFKTSKEENNALLSKQLRAKLYVKKPRELGFSKDPNDKVDLGIFEYYGSYDTKQKGKKTKLGAKGDFLQSLQDLHNQTKPKLAFGGPIPRQRFMEGEEVTHRKSFLDNSFNPGMKLKSALQDTPRIIFKRQPKEYEKFPNMDHTSPHFEQFSEMFVGSRKASQFKRAVEYQRLYQEALKNNDVESANKYDKLNKLPANMRLLAAAKALPSAQEKARTNSFEDGNFDYEKNLLVNYSGKKTTTRHELGAHAAAYGASKEGSPLANSLFGSIGRRMGAYGKGSGETTLISEMQAHTIQSAKQKDKINSLKEFISSEKMAKLYKSEAHETLADSMQKGSEISTAGVLGGRHKDIEIDVLKRMMQDAYGDNPEVLAEKMSVLNPSDSSNKVNFGALFADSKQSKKYAVGGNVGRQMFADGDKATAKPQSFEEFSKSLNPKQLADFKEKIKSAKQIIVNARTSGSMKLKSVGFNFLGTKFNMIPNKDLADKGSAKSKDGKPTYDLKGVKSLDELLSKIPPNYSEELRAKIGRAQDKFLGTKNIKDLKFAYDFGDKRGPLNIQLEKDVIKFGSIASFPWKPKTRKEKRTEELRIATERNARKKAENIDKSRQKSETASELSSLISSIDEENQQNKFYGIARDTKVFEGSDQYKELQKKLALDRQRREGRGLPNSTESVEPEKLIGINENYKAIQPISGTSPQAQRLRMQMEERDLQGSIIGIAKDQKTKKEPRVKKTESERYKLARTQSAPRQEKTLFDESELSKIGTYQTQEQKFKDNADKIKRFRDAASESARVKFKLNSRQRRRAIANENLAENLKTLRFASGGLVPGTGNSDTVPMDLPEGSFVIRKSSVNKIGADNLAKASRFASGGVVPALLTPGEYVYSPQEASKIGSSKLHAMNKFAKFARGGPIGLGRSGKFDPNNPDDIKKLKETLEEQLRYEDPNKDESLVQIEVKQNTDEVQKRAQQYTSDENARQQAETTVNSRNALVARQSGRVAVSQQNVNAAAGNVASATTARDSYITEANTQRGLVSSSRQEATRQQARITSLTASGASATDPRLIAANTALIAATTAESTARNLQARATRNAISANNQVVANTNTLNGLLVTHGQEVRNLTRAENAATTAVQGLEAATIKAEGSAQLLDEYQQDAAGKILLAGKVIGETKPLSGRGSMENALKRKEADYKDQTGRMPGKDEREILKGDVLSEYRASAEKQLRAKSVQSGKPISELNLQTTADQYTREFSQGKRKANYNKQGEIIGDRSLAGDLTGNARRGKTNTDYTAEGDLTSKGKIKDFASRAIFGAKRTDFEAGSEGDQQFKQSRGSSLANKLTMAAVGANFASERIKASGGTVAGIVSKGEGDTVKVDENAASGFKSAQAFGASLSSASTYAATAAQSLAKFGPVVAGVGAGLAGIVGAIEGYHNGIKQAEAEIRDAKIAQALNNLQNIFERVSNGLLEVNDSTLRKISENQKVVSQENATKAYEESGGNASALSRTLNKLTFGLAGNDVDTKKFNEALSKSTKETNAAQIGPLTNVLNKYSEQIGKDAALKIKSGGGDIATTNFEDIRGKLLEELRSGGGGAGKEQIAKIASAQDISIADAEKQFIKTLQESFQAEKIKSITTKSVQENAKAINSMQALSNAVNAAAASADSFSSKLDTNSSLFEGSIGSTKLTSFSEKSGGSTPDFAKFNTAIAESAGALGVYGEQFKNQGNAVNTVSQILPDILAQSVANPISGKETATQITDALKEGLKARGITGSAADQVVSSIGGKISSEDFTKLLAEAGGDVSKATQKLLSDIRDPLISAFTEIDNKLTEAGNKYISGLEDLAKRQKAIGDQIGRLSDLRGRSRSFVANEIQRLPGVQQGTAESINLQGARNDFSQQQQRLTGFGAGAAENPAAIASRLKKTQEQIRVQEEKVINTNKSKNSGAEFRNAALELTKLKSQASNLNDALKNLTDQSKKLEAAQAKLAQVRQNIDEKRSLGRKLLTQSPEEQQKMLQGQAIFNQVQARGGNLQGMSTEQNAILFDFLDNFGTAGKKIQDQILDASGYGAGKDDKAEEKALIAEQARIFAQQEEAQRQIIANQQSLQQDYFSNLDSRNEKFYSELQKFIQEMQKNTLIAEKGKEQQKVAQIKDVQKEGKFLGESGFNTKEDFEKLSTYKGSVETLVKNKQETTRTDELAAKAIATNGDIPLQQDFLTGRNRKITGEGAIKFEQNLTQNGYKASEAQRIREIAQQKLDEGANKNEVQTLARKQFHEEKSFGLKQEKEQVATVFKGSGIEGKLNNLVEKLASGTEISLDQFNRALASVKELQLGVGEGLSTAAIGAETRIKALNEAINGLGGIQQLPNAEVKPQVSAFAVGGSVFKSRGTDTVPAMLTPGEFVVNRSATQQNLPLLQSINSGKTSYLAEGGIAGYINNTMNNASSNNFMNSDEYNEAMKNQKKLNVGSFSEEIRSNANKVNKAKRNKDYFTTEKTRDVSDRDILDKEFSKGRTPYRVEKSVFDENFLTNSYDWLSKLNPDTELGFDQSKVERIGYFKKLYDKDYNSKITGIDSWKESSDFLKKQTISDSTLFRGIQQTSTLGFANSYLTTSRFNEAFPKTTLYKKYDNVLKSDTDYLGRTIDKINELEEQPNKNKTIIEQARKAFETRRLKEIEDSKKQEDQKNAESKKNEITKKLDTSKETGSIENSSYILGAIAKTKDIEEQKKKLKESGIQDSYVNTGKIFEDVGQSNVDQFIKEKGAKQDNYFLRRKGSPEAIAKIYLQREAQAQAIIGKLELMQSPEYSDDPNSIDPKTAYAVGQEELKNLIDGKETKINKKSLDKISSGQKKIVSSYITMNSFEKAATSKGPEMVAHIDKYGKALNKDPQVLVDSLIKEKKDRTDISGDDGFITAQAQGIFEALMFLDREAKANKVFANRNQIKKGKGLLGVLEEKSEKNIKSFTKFGKLKGNIDDKGLGIVDFGAKDPTEVDFNATNFRTAIPPQSIEEIKKLPSSKNGLDNNLLTALKATPSISNYGYLNFPTVKDDVLLGLEKDGGLFKVNSFPKQDAEGKTTFERQAAIALLENKNTYQQLVEISKQIKGTPSVDLKDPSANVQANLNQNINTFDPNGDPAQQIKQIQKEKQNAKAKEAKEAKTTRRDVKNLNKVENPRFNVGQRVPTRDEFQNDTVDLFKNFVELKNTLYRQKSKELIVGQDSDKIVNTDQSLYEGEKEAQYGNNLLASSFKYFTRDPNAQKLDYSIREISAYFPIEEPYTYKLNRYPELLAKIANFYKFGEQTEGSPEYVKSVAKLKNDAEADSKAISISVQNAKKMEDYYDSLIQQNNLLLEPPTAPTPVGFDPTRFATQNSQIPLAQSKGGIINYLATGGNVPSYRPNPNPSYFKPKGTDTVPAMLSPGEFVINASATAKHGDLLSAINSGKDVGYSSTGGMIYLEDGGEARKKAFYEKMNRQKAYEEEGKNLVDDKDKYSFMQNRKDMLESTTNKATQKFSKEEQEFILSEQEANSKTLHTVGMMGTGFNIGRAFITQGIKAMSGHGIGHAAKHFGKESAIEVGSEVLMSSAEKSLHNYAGMYKNAGGLINYLADGGDIPNVAPKQPQVNKNSPQYIAELQAKYRKTWGKEYKGNIEGLFEWNDFMFGEKKEPKLEPKKTENKFQYPTETIPFPIGNKDFKIEGNPLQQVTEYNHNKQSEIYNKAVEETPVLNMGKPVSTGSISHFQILKKAYEGMPDDQLKKIISDAKEHQKISRQNPSPEIQTWDRYHQNQPSYDNMNEKVSITVTDGITEKLRSVGGFANLYKSGDENPGIYVPPASQSLVRTLQHEDTHARQKKTPFPINEGLASLRKNKSKSDTIDPYEGYFAMPVEVGAHMANMKSEYYRKTGKVWSGPIQDLLKWGNDNNGESFGFNGFQGVINELKENQKKDTTSPSSDSFIKYLDEVKNNVVKGGNTAKDVGYSATGGLIEYLATGDSPTSYQSRLKNAGITPKEMMEAIQSGDQQKIYEINLKAGDAQNNSRNEIISKQFERQAQKYFNLFNEQGPDANKKAGVSRIGDLGNYAEGPQKLGSSARQNKPIQLAKIEAQTQEQEKPQQRTMPLAPPPVEPPKEPDPTTSQSSDTNEDDIKKKRAAEDEQRQNAKDLKDAKAALHGGGQEFVTNAQVRTKAEEIKRNRELDAQIAIWQAELEGIQNLSKGGSPRSSSDTIPAMLTPGEFVVNARQSSKNASLLHAINSGEDIQGFANGGPVGYYVGGKTSGGRPSDRFSAAANNFNLAVSNFDRAISRMSIPSSGSNNTAQYIDIAKSSFEELSRILKTEIKIGSGPIDKFNNAVTQFGTNLTGFNSGFSSSLEKFKTYVDELNAAINRIPGTLNLEIMGTLNASLNVSFDTSSVYAAVTNATESLKGWITSEIDRQITDEMF